MDEALFVLGCGLSGRYLPLHSCQNVVFCSCSFVAVSCENCLFFSSPSCSSYLAREETLGAAAMGEAVEIGYEHGGPGQDCVESEESSQSRGLHV
jgi:hypothetical protein